MAIQYEVESLDGIDEAKQSLYKEKDGGGYVLDVAGVVPKSRFDEVNQKAVDNATEAQRRRKTVERVVSNLGLEDASGLDDAIEALKANKSGKSDADQEAVIAQIKQAAEGRVSELEGKLVEMQLSGAKSSFESSLIEAGFPSKAAKMFAAANMNRVQLDESGQMRIMSENGTPLAGSGADGFATIGDLSKELAEAMPEFLVDKGKGGGGKAPASGGGNAAPNGKFGSLAAKIPGFSDLPAN